MAAARVIVNGLLPDHESVMYETEAVSGNQAIQLWYSAPSLAAQRRLAIARRYQNQFDRLDQEFPNLQQVQAQLSSQEDNNSAQLLHEYVQVMAPYLQQRGLDTELLQWCQAGLAASHRLAQNPGWLLLCLGGAQNRLGLWQEAKESFLAAIEASQGQDINVYAQAMLALGRLQLNQGDYRLALKTLAEAEAALNDTHSYEALATVRAEMAAYYLNRGELDQALSFFQQADQLHHRSGAVESSDHIVMMFGVVYRKKGEYERAIHYLQQLLDRGESQGNRGAMAPAAHHLAWVYLNLEKLSQARHYCGQAITLYEEMDDPRGASDAYEQLGLILLAEDRIEEAITQLERSLTIRRRLGNQHGAASSLRHLALAHWQMGHRMVAIQELWASLILYWRLGVLSRYRLVGIGRELYEGLVRRRKWTI